MAILRRKGFTLIEVMIVVAIIGMMVLIGIWAYRLQLLKGRDARRKANLAQWQKMLEDYINDNVCYPEGVVCGSTSGTSFEGYLSELPCDPLNNVNYNYMYTYETGAGCNKWHKIYTKLENEKDPIIAQVGCKSNSSCPNGGCGPSCNYNYWIGSPNVTEVAQLPNEFWPDIPGSPGGPGASQETSPPSGSASITPSQPPLPSASAPIPLETDPICKILFIIPHCNVNCVPGEPNYPGCCGACCASNDYRCDASLNKCIYDPVCAQ